MPTQAEIDEAIAQAAYDGVKKQRVGNEETEQMSAADQIALAGHAASNDSEVRAAPHLALRFARTNVRVD